MADGNTAADLKLKVGMDTTQADAGAARAQADVNAVASSTVAANQDMAASARGAAEAEEDQTAATEKLNASMREHQLWLMQNAFYVHRLAEGIKDISLGGRAASQGLMDISESLQYMLGPEMAIYAAMAQVLTMLALMATSHRGAGEAAREHAKEEEDAQNRIAEAVDKGTQSIIAQGEAASKAHLDVLNDQLKEYLANTKAIIEQADRWDQVAAKRLKQVQEEADATQKQTLALLENARQRELNNAHGKGETDVINAKYAARELQVKGAGTDEVYAAQQQALFLEKRQNDSERGRLVDDNNDMRGKLAALQKEALDKAKIAEGDGFRPDEAGSFAGAIRAQEKALKQARENADKVMGETDADRAALRSKERTDAMAALLGDPSLRRAATEQSDKTYDTYTEERGREKLRAQDNVKDITTQLADLRDAEQARTALKEQGEKLTEAMKTNSASIDKLVDKLADIGPALQLLASNYVTAKTQDDTDAQKLQRQSDEQKAKDDLASREADRYAQRQAQQAVIDDPNSSDEAKGTARAQQDQIEAAGKQDQIANAGSLGLGPDDVKKLMADLGLLIAKAGDAIATGEKKQEKADDKGLTETARNYEQLIAKSKDQSAITQMNAFIASHEGQNKEIVNFLMKILQTLGVTADKMQELSGSLHDVHAKVSRIEASR